MDTQKNLEKELWLLEQSLEKEKTKRMIILILVNSLLVAVLLFLGTNISSVEDLLSLIGVSLLLGGCLFFFSTASFALVSTIFTNTDAMERRKKYLEEELRKYKE